LTVTLYHQKGDRRVAMTPEEEQTFEAARAQERDKDSRLEARREKLARLEKWRREQDIPAWEAATGEDGSDL
jgi:hypothetical protein